MRQSTKRFLAAKPGVREGSAAQNRTCIAVFDTYIHTYLSISVSV